MADQCTLNYIAQKFGIPTFNQKMPIEILEINRQIMAQTLNELGFMVGAEIGVARGDHAELLFQNIPNLKLYGIDPWEQYSGYNEFYGSKLSRWHGEALKKLAKYSFFPVAKYSIDAVKDFADRSLDFVYIDGAHDFMHVAEDICLWVNKIKKGGIIYGHDYKRSNNPKLRHHVVDVVCGYTYSHRVRPWFVLGMQGKADGLYREGTRSWMWVV